MSETITGLVEKVSLVGPKVVSKGKNEGKTFHIHEYHINEHKYSQFDFRQQPVPSAIVGDNVNVVFTETTGDGRDGKTFTNRSINSIAVLAPITNKYPPKPTTNPLKEQTTGAGTGLGQQAGSNTTTYTLTPSQGTQFQNGTNLSSKDASIITQAVVKSLLEGGTKLENLEAEARAGINLVMKLAKELETGGVL